MRRRLIRRDTLNLIGVVAALAIITAIALLLLLLGANASASPASLVASSSQPASSESANSMPVQVQTATATTGTPPSTTPPARRRATPRPSTTSTSAAGGTSGTTPTGCAITSAELSGEQHLLSLLNSHRAAAGVPALKLDMTLSNEARAHSCDMFQHHTLSHTGSDGSTPFQRIAAAGVAYRAAGENIGDASGFTLTAGLDADDSDMMAEPLTTGNHHWNIVYAAYSRVGLGVIYQGSTLYFTEDFVG